MRPEAPERSYKRCEPPHGLEKRLNTWAWSRPFQGFAQPTGTECARVPEGKDFAQDKKTTHLERVG